MHACYIDKYGGPEQQRIGELPEPALRADAVCIRVHAAGLNPVDYKTREGKVKILLPYRMPLILGNELCGEVIEVGAQVSTFRVGERVAAIALSGKRLMQVRTCP